MHPDAQQKNTGINRNFSVFVSQKECIRKTEMVFMNRYPSQWQPNKLNYEISSEELADIHHTKNWPYF